MKLLKNLFILDMANNHQGSLAHGSKIINEHSKVIKKYGVDAAIKFQFRNLDTFIHKSHQSESEDPMVNRFLSTRLEPEDYQILFKLCKKNQLKTICTPFDEKSVELIVEMGFDLIKVASASAKDWPLLEKVAKSGLPVVFSTGGLIIKDIDNIISFFNHRAVDISIMHCVSIYPTPDEEIHLKQIDYLIKRYPGVNIGWSTHEDPNDTIPVTMAVAKGAQIFERHIGIETSEIKLNKYSSTPLQIDNWLKAYQKANVINGLAPRLIPQAEKDALDSLRRGVFVKSDLKKGDVLTFQNTYFATPYEQGQLSSDHWKEGIKLNISLSADTSINLKDVSIPKMPDWQILKESIHEIKALLNYAGVDIGTDFDAEFSHHYGIKKFRETGTTIINCINREYCKKILIQLPGQFHPSHFHKRKEETFQILYGTLDSSKDGRDYVLNPGDTLLVKPGIWHSFSSKNGCVFEEVSTTHFLNDSVYQDQDIMSQSVEQRKTKVMNWGRFELLAK